MLDRLGIARNPGAAGFHTFGILPHQQNGNLEFVQKVLRHSNLALRKKPVLPKNSPASRRLVPGCL
jgi:hypothetical protein